MKRIFLTVGVSFGLWALACSAYSQSAPTPSKPPKLVTSPALMANCAACHQAPVVTALPDMKSWIRLLYTSACPEVTIQLTEPQRIQIKTELQSYFDSLKK